MKTFVPKLFVLMNILSDLQFHSGNDLGKTLGISRNAIWKYIQQLDELGVQIESIRNKGYRLLAPLILLQSDLIKKALANKYCDFPIDVFADLPSSNDYLKTLPGSEQVHICLAEHQSKGRGRLGRAWTSPFAANICFSYRWPIAKDISQLGGLSLVVGLSLIAALKKYGLQDLYLKWPNDILWHEQKLAGILVEVTGESHAGLQAIIGIGLNVNMPSKMKLSIERAWTSLEIMYPRYHDRNAIVALMISTLSDYLEKFNREGFDVFMDEWRAHDYLAGKGITLQHGHDKITGVADGVNASGHLLLKHHGKVSAYLAGETSIAK